MNSKDSSIPSTVCCRKIVGNAGIAGGAERRDLRTSAPGFEPWVRPLRRARTLAPRGRLAINQDRSPRLCRLACNRFTSVQEDLERIHKALLERVGPVLPPSE